MGLEDNPKSSLSLADKRRALEEYHAKWENLNPVRKWEPGVGSNGFQWASVLGIYGVVADSREFIEFFTPESVSQGIPRKEWKIPLPQLANYSGFTFNPHSDMLVVVDWRFGWVLRYRAALSMANYCIAAGLCYTY